MRPERSDAVDLAAGLPVAPEFPGNRARFALPQARGLIAGIGRGTGPCDQEVSADRRLYDAPWRHRAAILIGPSGFVAVLAGWITTAVGHQPYTVYGLLITVQSASPIEANRICPPVNRSTPRVSCPHLRWMPMAMGCRPGARSAHDAGPAADPELHRQFLMGVPRQGEVCRWHSPKAPPGSFAAKLGWFALYWLASITVSGIVADAIRRATSQTGLVVRQACRGRSPVPPPPPQSPGSGRPDRTGW